MLPHNGYVVAEEKRRNTRQAGKINARTAKSSFSLFSSSHNGIEKVYMLCYYQLMTQTRRRLKSVRINFVYREAGMALYK